MGTTTRKAFLTKAIVAAKLLKHTCPGRYVGIMLPAVQITSLLIAATYLAGKTLVMLNWTVGESAMRHCMETVKVEHILTVKSFFELV